MALLGCLNSCSAIFPYVSFLYKKSLYSPHFFLASVASAGAGKGIMAFTAILLDPTQEYYDQIRHANKKAYEQALLGCGAAAGTAGETSAGHQSETGRTESPVPQNIGYHQ